MEKRGVVFYYDRLEEILLVLLFAALVAVIFMQVFMRYAMNNSLVWTEEMGRYLFIWMSWLGISIGEKKGEHIRITALLDRFPYKAAQILNVIACLITIGVVLVTGYYSIILMNMLFSVHAHWISLSNVSLLPVYAAMPISCGLMILRSIASIKVSVRNYLNH